MCNQDSSRIRRGRDNTSAAQSVSILNCTKRRADMLNLSRIQAIRTQLVEHGLKQSCTANHAVLVLLRVFQLLVQVHVPPGLRNVGASGTLTVTGTVAVHNSPEKVQQKTEVLLFGNRIHHLPIVRLDHRIDGVDQAFQPSCSVDGIVFAWVLIKSRHDGLQAGAELEIHEQGPCATGCAHYALQIVKESLVTCRFSSYNVQETAVHSASVGCQVTFRSHRFKDLRCLIHARFVVFQFSWHKATRFCDGKDLSDLTRRTILIIAVILFGFSLFVVIVASIALLLFVVVFGVFVAAFDVVVRSTDDVRSTPGNAVLWCSM